LPAPSSPTRLTRSPGRAAWASAAPRARVCAASRDTVARSRIRSPLTPRGYPIRVAAGVIRPGIRSRPASSGLRPNASGPAFGIADQGRSARRQGAESGVPRVEVALAPILQEGAGRAHTAGVPRFAGPGRQARGSAPSSCPPRRPTRCLGPAAKTQRPATNSRAARRPITPANTSATASCRTQPPRPADWVTFVL